MCDRLQLAAIHESGHIVMAYLVELSCHDVSINENGDGDLHLDYGQFTCLIALLMSGVSPKSLIALYPGVDPQIFGRVATILCKILIAGSVAEALYTHRINESGGDFEISGKDKSDVESLICRFSLNEDTLVEEVICHLNYPKTWDVVLNLSGKLSANLKMSRNEIEFFTKCLPPIGDTIGDEGN